MLTAIIIDDLEDARTGLKTLIELSCNDVKVLGLAKSADEGIEMINKWDPEIVFLDVKMPNKDGFDMLKELKTINFALVFTTAYSEYALQAFRFSAIDYLTKPVAPNLLIETINRIKKNKKTQINQQRLEALFENTHLPINEFNKLAIPIINGFKMVNLSNIIYCVADVNYTNIYLLNNEKPILSSKSLKYYEELLPDSVFFRIHKSSIINLNMINTYTKSLGNTVEMINGVQLEVSERKKTAFSNKLLKK